MKKALLIFQILIRAVGTVMLILGLLSWTGLDPTLNLIKLHMLLGILLVISLWGLIFLGLRTHISPGLLVLMFGWSLVLPILGMSQSQILQGSAHWVLQVMHILIGIGALGQSEMVGGRIKTRLEEEASKVHKRPVRKVRVSD